MYIIRHKETGAELGCNETGKTYAFNYKEDALDFIEDNALNDEVKDSAEVYHDLFLTEDNEDVKVIVYDREDQEK